jgi:hypothetical protein
MAPPDVREAWPWGWSCQGGNRAPGQCGSMLMQVESSSITTISYDSEHNQMRVRFKSGVEYRYDLVPASVYRAFVEASSKGRFFSSHVRDRYPCRRVEDSEED